MTGFIEVGLPVRLIAIGEIVKVFPTAKDQHGNERYTAKLRDGSEITLSDYERQKLALHPVQLMPAEPGTSTIWTHGNEARPRVSRECLTAWALCMDGTIRPVTARGVNESVENPVWVEMSSGEIIAADNYTMPFSFENAATMVEHFQAVGAHSNDPNAPLCAPAAVARESAQ